ncbi:MAG: alpha/beta fold hydrolase [Acidimicrobiia bacterium]
MQLEVHPNISLEIIDLGAGGSTPLLLVHGFGGAKEDFADHLQALGQTRRVVTLDLRGHGGSSKPDTPAAYSLDVLAADVVAAADALGLDRFDLLGHSMGGMLARRIVLQHGARVRGLVLMDTCPGPLPGIEIEIADAGAELVRTHGMDELKRVLDALAEAASGPSQVLSEQRPGYREFNDWKFAQLSPVMWATLLQEMVREPDQLHLFPGIAVPTMVMVGAQDEAFVDSAHAMTAALPDVVLKIIPDAAHAPQFEQPEAWLAALNAFLAELDAR